MATHHVFVTGATGFIGRSLITQLLARGHQVTALCRPGSEHKLPPGCAFVIGDPLKKESYSAKVAPADTFVHLVGISHPSPTKANQFRDVDLASVRAAVAAAVEARVKHFVYLSVATPAPIMQSYIEVRLEGEALLKASGMNATFVKPWYVLGPGRRWPLLIAPLYWILERVPQTRDSARRLGFITLEQITTAMIRSIENPPTGIRVLDVPAMKEATNG